jgi:20S proteasome alpha/beta subunit
MPQEKAPVRGALLPASLMYFYSGQLMHFCSGVDTHIVGVTFNDLRGTAVTRLALVGCTEPEIATITGHSLRDVRSILDAHYLNRDQALAESAIRKLEMGYAIKTGTDASK